MSSWFSTSLASLSSVIWIAVLIITSIVGLIVNLIYCWLDCRLDWSIVCPSLDCRLISQYVVLSYYWLLWLNCHLNSSIELTVIVLIVSLTVVLILWPGTPTRRRLSCWCAGRSSSTRFTRYHIIISVRVCRFYLLNVYCFELHMYVCLSW